MSNLKPTTHNRQQEKKFSIFQAGSGWWLVVGCLLPSLVSASTIKIFTTPDPTLDFTKLTNRLSVVGNNIIIFLVGVALVAIIWGAFKYVRAAGDAEKIAEGRKVAVYGIIALFLMLSFWGFVMIIRKSLFG